MKTVCSFVLRSLLLCGAAVGGVDTEKDAARVVKLLDTGGKVVVRGERAYAFDASRYDFAREARAFRLGGAYGALKGRFVGPYYIKAKRKGAADGFNLGFKVVTSARYVDKSGKELSSPRDAPEGSRIVETAVGWSLGVVGGAGKLAIAPHGAAADKVEDADTLVKNSSAVRTEVDAMKLQKQEFGTLMATRMNPYGWYDRGSVSLWKDTKGMVRRVRCTDYYNHLKENKLTHDVYFDAQGNPRLALVTRVAREQVTGREVMHDEKKWQLTISMNAGGTVGRVVKKVFTYGEDAKASVLYQEEIKPKATTKKLYVGCAKLVNRADAVAFLKLADDFRKAGEAMAGN